MELLALIAVFFVFLLAIASLFFGKEKNKKRFENTKKALSARDDHIVYIEGNVGKGKTSLLCAMMNFNSERLINYAKSVVENFQIRFFDYRDFALLDKFIDKQIKKGVADYNIVFSANGFSGGYFSKKRYFDFLRSKWVVGTDFLMDYIQARTALIRNNFVMFEGGTFVDQNNGVASMVFSRDMIAIKDRYKSHDFSLPMYVVIGIDDKQSHDPNSANSARVAIADTGISTYERLIRHFGKGTQYIIADTQNFLEDVASERNLACAIYSVNGAKRLTTYPVQLSILKMAREFVYSIYEISKDWFKYEYDRQEKEFFRKTSFEMSEKYNCFKKPLQKINEKIEKMKAEDYVEINAELYPDSKSVGNKRDIVANYNFVFPCRWAWGSTEKYLYSGIMEFMKNGRATPQARQMYLNILTPNKEKIIEPSKKEQKSAE